MGQEGLQSQLVETAKYAAGVGRYLAGESNLVRRCDLDRSLEEIYTSEMTQYFQNMLSFMTDPKFVNLVRNVFNTTNYLGEFSVPCRSQYFFMNVFTDEVDNDSQNEEKRFELRFGTGEYKSREGVVDHTAKFGIHSDFLDQLKFKEGHTPGYIRGYVTVTPELLIKSPGILPGFIGLIKDKLISVSRGVNRGMDTIASEDEKLAQFVEAAQQANGIMAAALKK